MKPFIIATLICFFILVTASPVQATSLFSDDFNDGEFSNWEVKTTQQYNSPHLPCLFFSNEAKWQLQNGRLGIQVASPPCRTIIVPQNLDLTDVEQYEYEFSITLNNSILMERTAVIKWEDISNWYGIKIQNKSLSLEKWIGSREYSIPNDSIRYDFQPNQTYHFKAQLLKKNKIIIWINGVKVLEVQDGNPFSYGFHSIGLSAGVRENYESKSYFDDVAVREIVDTSPKQLNVPLFKQTEYPWRNHEYDTAKLWSTNPSVARWGCALTSMVMIMQHYGMHTMPDMQTVSPGTVNSWLKVQKDGYLKNGALNWLAVTRLVKLISKELRTPKLEVSRSTQLPAENIETAKSEILANRPVIMEIPGHFLVADGLTHDPTDLVIKDPAYTYTNLIQHEKSVLSLRKFTPSFTDLSYLLITHNPGLNVVIKNQQGEVIPSESFSESISDPFGEGEHTPALVTKQVPKPAEGQYSIEISQPATGKYELEIFAYDETAEVSMLQENGYVGSQPTVFNLEYKKSAPAELTENFGIAKLRELLKNLKELHRLSSGPFYSHLDLLTGLALNAELLQQRKYLDQLEIFINWNAPCMSQEARELLLRKIHQIQGERDSD